jgi:branched-chain amino acid transport system ATP-binding protein
MLAIDDLHVNYGRIVAVRGVSLTVEQGEIVGLIGSNGAGKSTTLGSVVGMLAPSSGSIRLDGTALLRRRPEDIVRLGVSLVPENRRIFPALTVAENLQLGAIIRRDREAVRSDVTRMFGYFPVLERLYQTPAGNLSGGEQQQLAIARALLSRPRLLLLDEPSLGLAPLLVNLVFDAIKTLREDGVTILLAEQFVTKTLAVADRVYALSRGRVAISGTPAALRAAGDFDTNYLLGLRAPKDGAA